MEKQSMQEKVQELTDKLEKGVVEVFDSEKYKQCLDTMSKFYNYSFNNVMLILFQKPEASAVAGFTSWKKNFKRYVKKGEKGIKILAPTPYGKQLIQQQMVDADTQKPITDEKGQPVMEAVERPTRIAFKVVNVFDISQTEGEPLPELVQNLTGDVQEYEKFSKALLAVSSAPIEFQELQGEHRNGSYFPAENKIAVKSGLSEEQTIKTLIHEMSHAALHNTGEISRHIAEVEAESVAYVVCQYYGIDTSDYSFGYVASWSTGKDVEELKASLKTIQKTSANMIKDVDERLQEYSQDQKLLHSQQESYKRPKMPAQELLQNPAQKVIGVER